MSENVAKFKVGDRVRVNSFFGTICDTQIREVIQQIDGCSWYRVQGFVGIWHENELELIERRDKTYGIKKVIFNKPATIVLWEDGTKTVVKTQGKDKYSKELGFAMCVAKKHFGNKSNFNDVFKKYVWDGE